MNCISYAYDIAVLGGGPAGIAAAVTAARAGKKVVLFEKNGFLGGAMAIGLSPLGFWHRTAENVSPDSAKSLFRVFRSGANPSEHGSARSIIL